MKLINTNHKGFTLIELLISMVTASILLLTVGILSNIANRSLTKLYREQQIYDDISYGFKLMQNRLRASTNLQITQLPSPWQGHQIQVNTGEMFGVCESGDTKNLVHRTSATTSCADSEVIFSASGTDTFNFNLSWSCDCTDKVATECADGCLKACTQTGTNCSCIDKASQTAIPNSGICRNTSDFITADVSGTKNKIPFDMQTAILRRNQ